MNPNLWFVGLDSDLLIWTLVAGVALSRLIRMWPRVGR